MIRLLAVDDAPINLAVIEEALSEDGYEIDLAGDGEDAWTQMQTQHYDIIVLDRMMPRLDGLSLLKRLKADARWTDVPVIMQTAAAAQQEVREGLAAGAHYYLTKPYEPEALRALVGTVASEVRERLCLREARAHMEMALGRLETGCFVFHTLEEVRGLAAALAHLCQEPTGGGMGLLELMLNAVEHGNLGITYAEKTQLRRNHAWEEEVARRLTADPWNTRRARIAVRRDGDEVEFVIADEGIGFDWQPFLDFDPERAFDLNGRGIAVARMLGFSSLEYQGCGNTVVVRTRAATEIVPETTTNTTVETATEATTSARP